MSKKLLAKKILLFTLISLSLFLCFNIKANAFIFSKYDVYDGGSSYTPNSSEFPLNEKNVTAIGFDTLYDTNKDFFKYKGEIPYSTANQPDGEYAKGYNSYNGNKINGRERLWSNKIIPEENLTPVNENEDPHIWSLSVKSSMFSFWKIILSILNAINWIINKIINLIITFKSFNVSSIVDSIDANGQLSSTLSSIFLVNTKTGNMSPILIFGLALFVISFIALSFKVIKGSKSGRNVLTEFGFFILSISISAVYLNPFNSTKLSKIGTDFMSSLSNDVIMSANDSTSIFKYSTGNEYLDNSATQKALISKTYIDQMINAQFGYSIDDLYIVKPNGEDGNFGSKEEIQDIMKSIFGQSGNIDSMSVVTSLDGQNRINNLGYYLYAANSGTAIYDGTNQTSPAFYNYGGSTVVRTGSSDRMLYVIDFLAEVKARNIGKNESLVNKVDKIMNNLTIPKYSNAASNVFLITLQNISLLFGLICVAIFTIIGQMIIAFGSYCMVIMPTLFLFNGTRLTANKMMWSYLFGFIRFLIGSALFNIILTISTLLSQQGIPGVIASIIVCFILGKFGPNLLKELNEYITYLGRGKELRIMSNVYRNIDKGFDNYSYKNRKIRKQNALILNEEGGVEKVGSKFNNIQEGLRNGENVLNFEKGLNPFGEKRKDWNQKQIEKYERGKLLDEDDLNEVLNKDENKKEVNSDNGDAVERKDDIDHSDNSNNKENKVKSNNNNNNIVHDEYVADNEELLNEQNNRLKNNNYSNIYFNNINVADKESVQDKGEEANASHDALDNDDSNNDNFEINNLSDQLEYSAHEQSNELLNSEDDIIIDNEDVVYGQNKYKSKSNNVSNNNSNNNADEIVEKVDITDKYNQINDGLNSNISNVKIEDENIYLQNEPKEHNDNNKVNKLEFEIVSDNSYNNSKIEQPTKKDAEVNNQNHSHIINRNIKINKENAIKSSELNKNNVQNKEDVSINNELNEKEKLKQQKKANKKIQLTNIGLKAVNSVPIVGPTANNYIANRIANEKNNKDELINQIVEVASQSEEPISMKDALEESKKIILSNSSNSTKYNKHKSMEKTANKLNQGDKAKIKEKLKLKR